MLMIEMLLLLLQLWFVLVSIADVCSTFTFSFGNTVIVAVEHEYLLHFF